MAPDRFHPEAIDLGPKLTRSPSGLSTTAREGKWIYNPTLGSLEFSAQFLGMLGIVENELPNKLSSWRARVHPDDRLLSMIAVRNHFRYGHPLDFQQRLLIRNGIYQWFRVQGSSQRTSSGMLELVVGTISEIPAPQHRNQEITRLSEELAQARQRIELQSAEIESISKNLVHARQQTEAANRAKHEFLANVSHEIRTPLTAIFGYLDLLASQNGSDFLGFRHAVNSIHRNAAHLMTVVDDILEMSSLEAGPTAPQTSSIEPVRFVHEIASWFVPRAEEKGLTVDIQCDNDLPAEIVTDPVRLRQILFNLMGNAVKFTERGTIRLLASLRHTLKSVQFCIEVRDTGIGLAPEQVRNLFRPFTQGDGSPTRVYGGNGLGLAVSSRLARLLDGELEVESTPNVGSCFRLVIPVRERLSEAGTPSSQAHLPEPGQDIGDHPSSTRGDSVSMASAILPPQASPAPLAVNVPESAHRTSPYPVSSWSPPSTPSALLTAPPPPPWTSSFSIGKSLRESLCSLKRKFDTTNDVAHETLLQRSSEQGKGTPLDDNNSPQETSQARADSSQCDTVFDLALAMESARGTSPEIPPRSPDDIPEKIANSKSAESVFTESVQFALPKFSTPLEGYANPAKEVPPVTAQVPEAPAGIWTGCRVLVVDDGPDNRRLLSFLLERAGVDVSVAENGLQGCEKAWEAAQAGSPFDLILMDMQMPVLDGYAATSQLRKEGYDRPIVAITAHAMKADRDRCLQAGCDDYATKPIDRKRLLEIVAHWVDRRKSQRIGRQET